MVKPTKTKTDTASPRHGNRPIPWGTVKDVVRFDTARQAAVDRATQTFTQLANRSYRSASTNLRTRITPWLLIRYTSTDRGARPIPSGQAFWESPDIWIDSGDPSGNAVAGRPNFVHARLFNLGAFDAMPVRVDFYWGDPSLGLNAAHMHLIGTEYVQARSLRSVDVRCNTPWIPVLVNQGHECVMVNAGNWVADPIINPFQPILDRHVGQRNLTVIPASAGMLVLAGLKLGNLFPNDVTVNVVANIAHLAVDDSFLKTAPLREVLSRVLLFDGRRQKGSVVAPVTRSYEAAFLEAQLSGPSRFFNLSSKISPNEPTELREAISTATRPGMTVLDSKLRAGEQRGLEIKIGVPQAARPGEFIVCRFSQTVRNQTLGGYTVVIRVMEN